MKNQRKKSFLLQLLKRRWFWIIVGFMALISISAILTPYGLDYSIKRYFIENGADYANVGDVDFNPFTRRLAIYNLEVSVDNQDVLKIPEASFFVSGSRLFKKHFYLKRATFKNIELTIAETRAGRWQIGGILLAGSEEKSGLFSWGFGLRELNFSNSKIKLRSSRLSSDIIIEHAKIARLASWVPKQMAQIDLSGKINDGRLQFQGAFSPFGQNTIVDGTMTLQGLTLTPFAQLIAPAPDSLQGRLDADVRFQGKYSSEQGYYFEPAGHLALNQSQMRFADVEIVDEDIVWDGEFQIKLPNASDELYVNATGKLEGKTGSVNPAMDQLSLKHSRLVWNGKFALAQKQNTTDLSIDGGLKLDAFEMAAAGVNLAEKSLGWNGNVQIKMPGSADLILITAIGKMDANGSSLSLTSKNFALRNAGLNWDGELNIVQKAEISDYRYEGALSSRGLQLDSSDVALSNNSLKWNGRFELLMDENIEKHQLTSRGKLESENQVITFSRDKMDFECGGLRWDGQFNSELINFPAGLAAEGDLSISNLAVTDMQRKLELLASKTINLKSFKADTDTHVSIAEAKISGLNLIGQTEPVENDSLFSASEVQIDSIILDKLRKLSIQSVRIVAAGGMLHQKSDGRWLYINDLESFVADSDRSQKKPSSGGSALEVQSSDRKAGVQAGVQIGSLEIVGDSALHFEDETVNPTFRTELRLKKALLTDVDSYQPEKASPFFIEALSGKYADLKLQGTVQPFGERIGMDLKGKIRALEMPPLSPYAVKTIGYDLISGEMDADIDLKIVAGQLEGEADLKFNNPIIKAVSPEKLQNRQGRPIPLQSALKILRDNDNDVHLKVPISGDVNDPEFSFSDAINQALIKGLTMATLSYLKYMLGPYGMAISIVELGVKMGAEALTGIRLNPVEFQPGSSEPDAVVQEYVEKVAQIMKEKKDVRIRLCGWATESDRTGSRKAAKIPPTASGEAPSEKETASDGNSGAPAKSRSPLSDEEMLALAEQRADRIEDMLVSQHGIKNNRIFICKPEIDQDPEGQPRVELVF